MSGMEQTLQKLYMSGMGTNFRKAAHVWYRDKLCKGCTCLVWDKILDVSWQKLPKLHISAMGINFAKAVSIWDGNMFGMEETL